MGLVPLLARAGILPADLFNDLWRWWPLLLIGLGIALLLGRSQAGLIGTALLALILGTLVGSVLAGGNLWLGGITECASSSTQTSQLDKDGTFSGDASVTIDLDCGSVDLAVQPGSAWTTHADYRGPEPRVDATASNLTLRTPDSSGVHRQDWRVVLGADALREIDLTINAASSKAILAGRICRNSRPT